jgi:hypothetical protein
MAQYKAVEADLQKQRDMIEGLISRVSAQEARAPIPDMVGSPMPRVEETITPEMMRTHTARIAGIDPPAPRPAAPRPAPAAAKPVAPPVAPMISDDLLSQFASKPAEDTQRTPRVDDSQRTQRVPTEARRPVPHDGGPDTQPVPNDGGPQTEPMEEPQRTQRLEPEAPPEFQRTQRMSSPEGDKTVKVSKLDPNWRPDSPEPLPTPGTDVKDATTTQRLDDSIQRLQEAKRLLQNLKG